MKAVILAAGVASRLRPLTNNTPKCLLKVGQKSILELTIEKLVANGISEFVIVTGYLECQIHDFINYRFPRLNITFVHNRFFDSTNNIYSLWLVRNAVHYDDMLLMDSDIVFNIQIISKLLHSGYKNCLALKRHEVSDEEIKVRADNKGKILEISKDVNPAEAAGESVGIEIFSRDTVPELFSTLDRIINVEKKVNQFYEFAFQELVNNGREIHIIDISEYFCMEIDTIEDLKIADEFYNKE